MNAARVIEPHLVSYIDQRHASELPPTATDIFRTRAEARAALFADLAVVSLDLDTFPLSTSGGRTLPMR